MQKFSKSKFAKATSLVVSVMTAVMMLGPVGASAATAEELTAQINGLLATITALQGQLSTLSGNQASASASCFQFNSDLELGDDNADVKSLQMKLNASADTQVSSSGNGAPGMETTYFGAKTKAAVQKYQTKMGIAPVAGYVGPKTRASLNSTCTPSTPSTPSTPGMPATAGVSASLASDSPIASTLISGTVATVAKFTLWNGNATPVKVTALKMKRTGISSDSTLTNVYLYNGAQRLTDSASVSQSNINFVDTAGIVSIPAMSSVTVSVRVEVATGQNGQTVGMMLTELTTDSSGATTGLPVSASQHNIATAPSGMMTADFVGAVTPAANTDLTPQNDYTVWQSSVIVSNRDASLKSIRFRQIGSVLPSDLANFRLMVDGQQVGTAVATLDSLGYVTFDFTSAPKTLMSGTRVVKLVADIISGSGRNFKFSLRQASDIQVSDSQLGVDVIPTAATLSFSARESGQQDVAAGVLTITKETDSPSGNVTNQASNITLAKFKFKAQGEKIKVESLKVGHSSSTAVSIRNGAIYANGTQIGSVAAIEDTANATTYNLGSSLVVEPGKDVIVEIKGDVVDSDSTAGGLNAGDTLTFSLVAGTSNAQRLVKLDYVAAPASAVAGNSLTVAAGSMTLSKYAAFANQTVVVPQTAVKIGEFRLQAGSTEDVNLNTITLALGGNMFTAHITDLYVVYGAKTTAVKASSGASQTWSINELLTKNSTLDVKVFATLAQSVVTGSTTIPTLTFDGNAINSGSAVTSSAVVGQTITAGTGNLTAAADASTPIAAVVVGGSQPKVASFKFTGTNETFTITELYASTTATGNQVAGSVIWKDGATTIATTPFSGAYATTTGLSLSIPANSTKVIDAYIQLASVGLPGNAPTGLDVQVGLDGFKYRNTNGVETAVQALATDVIGNHQYVVKSKPTVSNSALPSTTLTGGVQTIGKVTISADSAGTIAWRKIVWTYSTTSGVLLASPTLYDSANESTALTGVTLTLNLGTMTIVASSTGGAADQEVSGSKTYVLKANVSETDGLDTGDSVSTSIGSSALGFTAATGASAVAATAATFVWSDESVVPHSDTAASWYNDALIKNVPTDSQTLTK